MNKSSRKKRIVKVLAIIGIVAFVALFIFALINRGGKTSGEAEQSVRRMVPIGDQKLVNAPLLVNSNEALDSLKKDKSGAVEFRDAKVGDYRLAFETVVVIYRPSTDQIVNITQVSQGTKPTETKPASTPSNATPKP